MNTDIVSIDAFYIEEMPEEPASTAINETGPGLPETPLPLKSRFGIADLWKIRSARRHFIFYR